MLLSCFLSLLPIALVDGIQFPFGCKLYSSTKKEGSASIGKVYILEAIGMMLGGIIFTYVFLKFFNSFYKRRSMHEHYYNACSGSASAADGPFCPSAQSYSLAAVRDVRKAHRQRANELTRKKIPQGPCSWGSHSSICGASKGRPGLAQLAPRFETAHLDVASSPTRPLLVLLKKSLQPE